MTWLLINTKKINNCSWKTEKEFKTFLNIFIVINDAWCFRFFIDILICVNIKQFTNKHFFLRRSIIWPKYLSHDIISTHIHLINVEIIFSLSQLFVLNIIYIYFQIFQNIQYFIYYFRGVHLELMYFYCISCLKFKIRQTYIYFIV